MHAETQLVALLITIADGADANKVLGVAGKRGIRKSFKEQDLIFERRMALAWVASAIRPDTDGGFGYSLERALELAANDFGFKVDSLRAYWTSHPEWRTLSFPRPLFTFPDVDPKG